jgi:predicted flap endonuclease-1-like 5' DNA nuclease
MQILLCLLIAGLIGALIGWLLRGGCSKKIKLIEEEHEMKLREVEREWNTKLNYSDKNSHVRYDKNIKDNMQASADLKSIKSTEIDLEDIKKDASPYLDNNSSLTNSVAAALGTTEVGSLISTTDDKSSNLNQDRLKLYTEHGIDIDKTQNLEDEYNIQDIDGINSKHAKKLKKLGINSTKDLAEKLTRNYEDIDFIAKKLHVGTNTVNSWISMADLLSLPGVGVKHAKLIQKAGISSSLELSAVNIHSLYSQLLDVNNKSHIVSKIPNLDTLKQWAKIAKLLDR